MAISWEVGASAWRLILPRGYKGIPALWCKIHRRLLQRPQVLIPPWHPIYNFRAHQTRSSFSCAGFPCQNVCEASSITNRKKRKCQNVGLLACLKERKLVWGNNYLNLNSVDDLCQCFLWSNHFNVAYIILCNCIKMKTTDLKVELNLN